MKKFDATVMKAFLYELPLLVLFILTCMIMPLEKMAQENFYVNLWYQFGGFYIFGSWLLTALYISMKLLLAPNFRQLVLAKLTFMRERDERDRERSVAPLCQEKDAVLLDTTSLTIDQAVQYVLAQSGKASR